MEKLSLEALTYRGHMMIPLALTPQLFLDPPKTGTAPSSIKYEHNFFSLKLATCNLNVLLNLFNFHKYVFIEKCSYS